MRTSACSWSSLSLSLSRSRRPPPRVCEWAYCKWPGPHGICHTHPAAAAAVAAAIVTHSTSWTTGKKKAKKQSNTARTVVATAAAAAGLELKYIWKFKQSTPFPLQWLHAFLFLFLSHAVLFLVTSLLHFLSLFNSLSPWTHFVIIWPTRSSKLTKVSIIITIFILYTLLVQVFFFLSCFIYFFASLLSLLRTFHHHYSCVFIIERKGSVTFQLSSFFHLLFSFFLSHTHWFIECVNCFHLF